MSEFFDILTFLHLFFLYVRFSIYNYPVIVTHGHSKQVT